MVMFFQHLNIRRGCYENRMNRNPELGARDLDSTAVDEYAIGLALGAAAELPVKCL
jgi:hypothetical protein